MRKVFSTGIVLSALLAWSALSVGQNTTPILIAQTPPPVVAAPVLETGTVVGGALGTGLTAAELGVLTLVAVGTGVAVTNTDNTTPSPAATSTATR